MFLTADGRRHARTLLCFFSHGPTQTHTDLFAGRPAAAEALARQALPGKKPSIASRLKNNLNNPVDPV